MNAESAHSINQYHYANQSGVLIVVAISILVQREP